MNLSGTRQQALLMTTAPQEITLKAKDFGLI
jgi:hypothetical protein